MTPLTDDQATVHAVAEFLTRANGPFHITAATAHALGQIFEWHLNLDSDQNGDNEVVLNAAKAFDVQAGCDTPADETAELRALVQQLLDSRIVCLPCAVEVGNGQRPNPNIANVINAGVGLCFDHAQAVNTVATGRSPGGILLPGQN